MKKKLFALLLSLSLLFSLAACAPKEESKPTPTPVQGEENQPGSDNPLAGTYDITVWVSEIAGVTDLTQQQINAFMEA
ncbi:MAG: hypothetical protein J6J87_00485, partial [Oscillospiraceae bacterium]|nr:hypothetical protein [Oscillospiraceae bacterium]